MEGPPIYAATRLPDYSPVASSHDRSSIITDRSITRDAGSDVYQYDSPRLALNLGAKRWGTATPTYGWEDIIEGYVHVKKDTSNVLSMIATIEGHVTAGRTERGVVTNQARIPVLNVARTLFQSSTGPENVSSGKRYPFFFPLPPNVTGGSLPLPPTFAVLHMGVATDVTYSIQVEVIRKGKLRQNERIRTFFLYLPRTYAPLPINVTPNHRNESHVKWQALLPLLRDGQRNVSSTPSDLSLSFALPRHRTFACGFRIPFFVKIKSGATTEAVSSLFTSMSVLLVRVTTLRVGSSRVSLEAVLGSEEIDRVEEEGDERIVSGGVTCSRKGETSWNVDGVEVKYHLRVKVSPRADLQSLARTLPTYQCIAEITMRTHYQTMDEIEDTAIPELSRMAS